MANKKWGGGEGGRCNVEGKVENRTSDRDLNADGLRHFAKDIRKIRTKQSFLHYHTLNV